MSALLDIKPVMVCEVLAVTTGLSAPLKKKKAKIPIELQSKILPFKKKIIILNSS